MLGAVACVAFCALPIAAAMAACGSPTKVSAYLVHSLGVACLVLALPPPASALARRSHFVPMHQDLDGRSVVAESAERPVVLEVTPAKQRPHELPRWFLVAE